MKGNIREENRLLEMRIGYASFAGQDAPDAGMPADGLVEDGPGAELCGDTAMSCWLPDGSRAVILSDGMGRGSAAAAESRLAVRLLSKRLKQGIPVARAIKEVNRHLLRRSHGRECFATVDLMILDRAAGRARFYKLGAAASYVLRGRRIRKVQQPALPVGIVPQLKLTHVSARLSAGDIIVMMSDGICDSGGRCQNGDADSGGRCQSASGNSGGCCRNGSGDAAARFHGIQEDDWVISYLNDLMDGSGRSALGPRQLAGKILEEARRRYGEGESDDATVVAVMIR